MTPTPPALPKTLIDLLRRAYSAEKAAALAYQGHAASLRQPAEISMVQQIEQDEWHHRAAVFEIMQHYGIASSRFYEAKFYVIGAIISASCHVIGRFMPFYFAGALESGNVCEYFRMQQLFNELGIFEHDQTLCDMGMKEKEHEIYFLELVKTSRLLPYFEWLFRWGRRFGFNDISVRDVKLAEKYPFDESHRYCRRKGHYIRRE